MRSTRLLQLLHLLAARGRLSAAELARRLDVSPRTIYRDVETLSAAGFPIYAEQGPTGGYELLADFRSPFVVLTPDEIATMIRLGPPPAAADLGLGDELRHAYDKLAVALARAGNARDRQLVLVDSPRWFRTRETPEAVGPLSDAVVAGAQIRTEVHGAPVVVDPLGLVDKAGTWYLVCRYEDDQLRAHRVDRLGAIERTGRRVDVPAGFELAGFWRSWSDRFETERTTVDVTLEVRADAVAELPKALGDHIAVALAAATPDHRGCRRIRVTFFSIEAAVHQLTGAGHLTRVIEPRWVADAVIDRAGLVIEHQRARSPRRTRAAVGTEDRGPPSPTDSRRQPSTPDASSTEA